ncbi:hypothetical protein MBFIL_07500 [Methanobrevibacter filiformis]|uniref:Uncharacterized protein n=1 Tax=Methanobrevibacter filiformis TaxID=55758 RepID=A0A166CZC1_9EURY|nr:hypothetical protein MBFIL_07500 [Methanobrevibacter filiformis]
MLSVIVTPDPISPTVQIPVVLLYDPPLAFRSLKLSRSESVKVTLDAKSFPLLVIVIVKLIVPLFKILVTFATLAIVRLTLASASRMRIMFSPSTKALIED